LALASLVPAREAKGKMRAPTPRAGVSGVFNSLIILYNNFTCASHFCRVPFAQLRIFKSKIFFQFTGAQKKKKRKEKGKKRTNNNSDFSSLAVHKKIIFFAGIQ